jgi:nitrate reductase alpha subunit
MFQRKTLAERYKGKCKHFTGVMEKSCAVGIEYHSFTDSIPCLPPFKPDMKQSSCASFMEYTPEEIAAIEHEQKAWFERFAKAGPLIARIKKENKGKNTQGIDLCPVCAGKLHWTHAGISGHVWGKCETPSCLSWIE